MADTIIPSSSTNVTRVMPKSEHKLNRKIASCKQKFSIHPIARISQFGNRATSMIRRAISGSSGRQDNQGIQNSSQEPPQLYEIQSEFKLEEVYTCPTGARIFSTTDKDYDNLGNLLKIPLGGALNLKLDPNAQIPGCISVLEGVIAKEIYVDFYLIIYLFVVKMINPYEKHYREFVEALFMPNFKLGIRDDDHTMVFGHKMPKLSPQMTKVRDLCAVIYASNALKIIFTKIGLLKKRVYEIQTEVLHRVSETIPNKNDVYYPLIFEEEIQLCLDQKEEKPPTQDNVHKINMRVVCNLYRVVSKETGKPQTLLSVATFFAPKYNDDNDEKKCPLWKNDFVSPTGDLEYERRKFEGLVNNFGQSCFLDVLTLIDPDFKQNPNKQARIREILLALEMDSQIVNDLINGKISWPETS
jgi:hypothetical protein